MKSKGDWHCVPVPSFQAASIRFMSKQHANALPDIFANALSALHPSSKTPIAIALSGGLDSTVLLHLAHAWAKEHGVALFAFHVHHGISPNADAWLNHCRAQCEALGVAFDAREVVLGQTQQGGAPSPFDRILGTRLAAHSIDWLSNQIDTKSSRSAIIGLYEGRVRILPIRQAEELADWDHRRPIDQWWMQLRPIIDVLAGRLAVTPMVPA